MLVRSISGLTTLLAVAACAVVLAIAGFIFVIK